MRFGRRASADRFAEIADLGSALRIVDREPATDVQGVAGAEFFARHRGEQHSAGFDRLDVLARIGCLRADVKRQTAHHDAEIFGATREREQLFGIATEFARQVGHRTRAAIRDAQQHLDLIDIRDELAQLVRIVRDEHAYAAPHG